MTSQPRAEDFLRQTNLLSPLLESAGEAATGTRVVFRTDEQSVVVGSALIVFAPGVSADLRGDLVHATALAQLVALKQVPQPHDRKLLSEWYAVYFETLANIGFAPGNHTIESPSSPIVDPHQQVLALAARVWPAKLPMVTGALNALKRAPEGPALQVAKREILSGQTGRFQLVLAELDSSGEVSFAVLGLQMKVLSTTSPALFSEFKSREIDLLLRFQEFTVNGTHLALLRDTLANKVRPYLDKLVVALEAPPPQSPQQEWLRLAPRPQALREGQRWHAYLSYRSIHRPWVVQLYDVLQTLGYKVFLDQLVLTPGEQLDLALQRGLEQSAAALLVWSSASKDSSWILHEYQAMLARETTQKDFRFIVVTLDRSPLPPVLAGRVYVDFSESREGPSGTPLLSLLYGLQGQAPPREVFALAAKIDEEVKSSIARIQAARSAGDAERLSVLASSEGQAWHASSTLLCQVVEALIALRETDRALAVLEQGRRRFPNALRLRQLLGLALARKGNWKEAQLVLEELYASGARDPETAGILARTWMDRYNATGDKDDLRRARDLYVEGFAAAPDDTYVGVNAASKSVLLGDTAAAQHYARQVAEVLGTVPSGDYWQTVTAAEVQLILGNFAGAADLYRAGIGYDPRAVGSHDSTYVQTRHLLDAMSASPADRQLVLHAFGDLGIARDEGDERSASSRAPLTPFEREVVAKLLFQLVAERLAAPDLLISLDAGRFWEAVKKTRPRATRQDLESVAKTLQSKARPSALWLAWMQSVRSRDLDRLIES